MSAGTWASVTDNACTCSYLEENAANPDLPIRYDPDLNEYSIVWPIGDGYGEMMIYHCPFCGGRTPESRRRHLFAEVSESEYQRLRQLTKDIASVEDALTVLGTPFRDEPTPMLAGQPLPTDRYGQPTSPVRILTFSEASEVVDVQVSVKADSTIEVAFGPKYIGPSKGAA